VLAKGHGRVFTGEYDERTRSFTKFEKGEEFAIARDIAEALVERGFVEILGAVEDPVERENWCHLAREHLISRADRLPETGCLVWRGAEKSGGYAGTTLLGKAYMVHRLAWLAHHGPIPDGLLVCHHCDNRLCLEPEHLFLGTPQQNAIDMLRKGRGRQSGKPQLDPSTVAAIKRRLLIGDEVNEIAAEMKVSAATIGGIKRGDVWAFVEPK
jgi:hypothetical protein